jgi:NADH-quinone oxidoreductase subunit N
VTPPQLDVGALGPAIAVAIAAVLAPIGEVVLSRRRTFLSRPVTEHWIGGVLALASAAALLVALALTRASFGGAVRVFDPASPLVVADALSHFVNATVLIGTLLTVLVSNRFLSDMRINHGEYYGLLLAAVVGMMFLASAADLLVLFLGVELMSIPLYVLAGFRRGSLRSNESALKYFLIGSFASAILLYGAALLYGATGTLAFDGIASRFDPESAVAVLGAGLLLIGLAFKIAAAPFHQWVPDVYEGAPTIVSGFMATTVKVAAFGALLRVITVAFAPGSELLFPALFVLALLTMTVGNVMAIIQQNTKRMLAYSSIAHAGYLLVGVVTGTAAGYSAVLFYLLVYTFMTFAAFAVIAILARDAQEWDRIDDLAGLARQRPLLAAVMALSMFSLAGIPLTAGFVGKFYVFRAAVERALAAGDAWLLWLAIAAVANSAISLVYYLRIPVVMYMREPAPDAEPDREVGTERVVLAVCAAAILLLGIWPENLDLVVARVNLLGWATTASAALLP